MRDYSIPRRHVTIEAPRRYGGVPCVRRWREHEHDLCVPRAVVVVDIAESRGCFVARGVHVAMKWR